MAYKTFANGFPLPASDLNNFLMNQSVIVFADAAARTTAIPSPVEGMLTYLEDTNAYESWNGSAFVNINDNTDAIPKSTVTTAQDLIVAEGASSVTRLGVGTNDQVLSVVAGEVAWADAGGGGGGGDPELTLLASGSIPTGATTATFTGLSGSDLYYFYFLDVTLSGPGAIYGYLNGTTTGKAVSHLSDNGFNGVITTETSGSYPKIGLVDASPYSASFAITVRGGSNTGSSLMTASGGSLVGNNGDEQATIQSLQSKGSAVLSSFSLLAAGVRTFSSGTYEIYGG
jgi:hypothetical protein